MEVMISVIIPVYNRAAVLQECVESVLSQSFQNFEILLIDDGSSDGSLDLCRKLMQLDNRILVLNIAHAGVSAARNHGIDSARGEYLFFLDSDDVIHPQLLETLAAGMRQNGAEIGGTPVINVPEKQWHRVAEQIAKDHKPGTTRFIPHRDAVQAVFRSTTPINLIGGVMIRRDLIGNTRFREDLYIGEDFYFTYENLIKGADVVFLSPRWYYCRIHTGNSSWDYSYAGFWTRFYRRELVWETEESLGRKDNANLQKQNAIHIYQSFLIRNDWGSDDSKKMRDVVMLRRKLLFPALPLVGKLKFAISLYLPQTYIFLNRLKNRTHKVTVRES